MTQQLSNCCKAQISVSSSDEGTSCFMCGECKKPCDLFLADTNIDNSEVVMPAQYAFLCLDCAGHMIIDERLIIKKSEHERLKEIESMYEGLCK